MPPHPPHSAADEQSNWSGVASLAGILGLRMLGLFMVLPVLSLYAAGMPGASGLAIGLAVGIYGLTQAALQIPFGRLSDRIGRKPVIVAGLLLFAAGSVLAAVADSVVLLILGRALQGAGAISAAITAFVSDLTSAARRTRAMAIVGVSIGSSFIVAFSIGPWLSTLIGVQGLFWLSAGFALAGLVLLAITPAASPKRAAPATLDMWAVFRTVIGPVTGIFLLHALLTAMFVALPVRLYVPVMLGSILLLAPLVYFSERGKSAWSLLLAVALLAAGLLGSGLLGSGLLGSGISGNGQLPSGMLASIWPLALALTVFFGGFNFMEAFLPTKVSLLVDEANRGTALGVYATAQFLGAFAGGIIGGPVLAALGSAAVLLLAAGVAFLWFAVLLVPSFWRE